MEIQATLCLLFHHWPSNCHSVVLKITFHSHQWDTHNQYHSDLSLLKAFYGNLKLLSAKEQDLNDQDFETLHSAQNFQKLAFLFHVNKTLFLIHYQNDHFDQIQKSYLYCEKPHLHTEFELNPGRGHLLIQRYILNFLHISLNTKIISQFRDLSLLQFFLVAAFVSFFERHWDVFENYSS